MLSQFVFSTSDDIARRFNSAKPFRYVVIDDFLDASIAETLLAHFPVEKNPSKLVNEFGDHNPKSAISDVRSLAPAYVALDEYIQNTEFLTLMSKVTGIPDLRYDPWYYGAGTHENFHGAGLEAHYDFNIHPHTGFHRRLNAIIYLNKDWNPDWRGDICLHTDPWDMKNDQVTSIAPSFNRCVIFETTESSWHSVAPVTLPLELRHISRKSFTIYLYTNDRPDHERAPEHGTVYVPPPLPEHLKPGHTLTEADVAEIDLNLVRRHQYLKNMYKREYKFSQVIDELRGQIREWQGVSRVPLLGQAKVVGVDKPLYPDGWMGLHLAFRMEARAPIRSVAANVWRPDDSAETLTVSLKVGSAICSQAIGAGLSEITLSVEVNQGAVVLVELQASETRLASPTDLRQISVILDSVSLQS